MEILVSICCKWSLAPRMKHVVFRVQWSVGVGYVITVFSFVLFDSYRHYLNL